jgi:hypothetical protein
MNQHTHSHSEHHSKRRGPHKDWRLWVVVVLALAAMLMYVFSDDEALQPGETTPGEVANPPVPAAP